jgi:hypothetical protein
MERSTRLDVNEARRRLAALKGIFPENGGFRQTLVYEVGRHFGEQVTAVDIATIINSACGTARNGHLSPNEVVTSLALLHYLVDVFTDDADIALMAKGHLWVDVGMRIVSSLPRERADKC